MVTVKEVKKMENAKGEEFYGLIVQSGAMAVKSNTRIVFCIDGKNYHTHHFDILCT